jgi:hypothetical protein
VEKSIHKIIFKKIGLYILSLWLLFLFVIVITLDISACQKSGVDLLDFLGRNTVPVVCVVFLLIGVASYFYLDFEIKGASENPFLVTRVENLSYEHLMFLATYVIPLISFDFGNERFLIVLGLLLLVMGIIYIKTDLFYANPSLALLGYRLYRVDGRFKGDETRENIIVICRCRLNKNDRVSYRRIGEGIYYARKAPGHES